MAISIVDVAVFVTVVIVVVLLSMICFDDGVCVNGVVVVVGF